MAVCRCCLSEKLYRTDLYGASHETIHGKRAKEIIKEPAIQKLLGPEAKCCGKGCLGKWKEELGEVLAEAIIRTELRAYGSMREDGRQVHFLTKLKGMARPKLEQSARRAGKVVTGRTAWENHHCMYGMMSKMRGSICV